MGSSQPIERKRVSVLQVLATIALAGALVYGGVSFLSRLQGTVVIVIASTFLAYLIYPVVRWLERRMPIVFAILVVYVAIAMIIALVVTFFLPPLLADATTFVKSIPRIIGELSHEISDPSNRFFAWLPQPVRDYVANLPQELVGVIQTYGFATAQRVASYVFSVVAVLATVIVVPILTAYIMLDQENLIRTFLGFFPEDRRPKAKAVLADLDHVLGGFIRGQLLDSLFVGVAIFVLLLILHVPYAYLVAVVSGIFQIVPYLGAIVAFIPAVVLALVNNGLGNAIAVMIGILIVHQVDGNLIAPRIMRDNVGLSPFWVVLSVLVFTELFGLVGTFVAVPAAAMLRVLKMHFLPEPVEPEEAGPTPLDEALRLGDDIANVERT